MSAGTDHTSSPGAPAAEGRSGSLFGGRYRLGGLLGVGGSASVYEAEDLLADDASGRPERVAVKVLHAHLCSSELAREAFLREAARASGLHHPNVIAVRGSGLHDAGGVVMAWIAFDLAVGPTVSEWVGATGRLPPSLAAAVIDGVLAGLAAAHAQGLVHRDVSPRNVILERADPAEPGRLSSDMVRLLDFGLADVAGRTTVGSDLLLAEPARAAPAVVGSRAFMSPEQACGRPVTAAGDVYQAGALLYYLLTGQPPYPRASAELTAQAHLSAPPPVPSALVPEAGPLDRVVTTAMAKEPDRRFPDADQFRAAVRAALAPSGRRPAVLASGGDRCPPTAVLPLGRGQRPGQRPLDYLEPVATDAGAAPADEWSFPEPSGWNPVVAGVLAVVAALTVLAVVSATSNDGSSPRQVATTAAVTPEPTPSLSATPTRKPKPVEVRVPVLTGTLADAERVLRDAGLFVGEIARSPSPEAAGAVLEQSPDAGALVQRGSTVNLEVASGTNAVPDVAGLTAAAATAELESAGFAAAADTQGADPTTPVLGSEPAAGVVLRLGVTVTLRLAAPTPSAPASSPGTPAPTGPQSHTGVVER